MVSPLFLSLKVRIPFGPSYCPPSPPPPLQGNSLSQSVYCLLLSLVVLHCAVSGRQLCKKGVEREKKNVYVCALPTFSHYLPFPSKGASWSWERAWHGHAGIGMCMHHHRFNSTFYIFYFILFRTLSLHRRGMPS